MKLPDRSFLLWAVTLVCTVLDVILAMIGVPVFWIVGTAAAERAVDGQQHVMAVTICGLLMIAIVVCMEAFCQGIRAIRSIVTGER